MKESKEKWVTPTQIEKGEKKVEMSREERREYLSTVKQEALWGNELERKIESGEAKDVEEAEEKLAKEVIEKDTIQEMERHGGCAGCFANSYFGSRDQNFKLSKAIEVLPYDEAMKGTLGLIEACGKKLGGRGCYDISGEDVKPKFARAFFSLKVKPDKNLEKFLTSPIEKFVSPEGILQKMARENAEADIIKMLLEKYKDKIDFGEIDLFGEDGILKHFKKEEKGKILNEVMTDFEKQTEESIRREQHEAARAPIWSTMPSGISWEQANVRSRLKHLEAAVKEGVILPDWKERLKKIQEATYHYPSMYSETAIRFQREEIEKVGLMLEKLAGEAKKITGKGLEFVKSEYSTAEQVYLDGELVGAFPNASFGEKATNGDVVAWVVSEVIDRDTITGTQNRDIVYAWKKGWKEPKQIFEDHAWSTERYFRVFAPEVTPAGKVKVRRIDRDKEKTNIFEIK